MAILEGDIASVADDVHVDLDQLLSQASSRPVLHRFGRREAETHDLYAAPIIQKPHSWEYYEWSAQLRRRNHGKLPLNYGA